MEAAKPRRKDMRLASWDYSSGSCYHITVCTHGRRPVLARINGADDPLGNPLDDPFTHELSSFGMLVEEALVETADESEDVSIENYVIMPNHVHVLVRLKPGVELGKFVGRFKAKATASVRKASPGFILWQRGYHDHIIRGIKDYQSVWNYIENNPHKWAIDEYHV